MLVCITIYVLYYLIQANPHNALNRWKRMRARSAIAYNALTKKKRNRNAGPE